MTNLTAVLEEIERKYTPVPPHDARRPLYHYTDAEGFHGIVEDGTIRATHWAFLNDREELLAGERVVQERAIWLEEQLSGLQRQFMRVFLGDHEQHRISELVQVCVASFSAKADVLSQWRVYAVDGGGYFIGFSDFPLPSPMLGAATQGNVAVWLARCQYDRGAVEAEAEQQLSALAEDYEKTVNAHGGDQRAKSEISATFRAVAQRGAAVISLRFKDPAFQEEEESRLIALPARGHEEDEMAFRASRRGLIPYIPLRLGIEATGGRLALKHVYVGPTQDRFHGANATRFFLRGQGYTDEDLVKVSSVPFRGTGA